jgi:putative ABC transport system substrate-binding protein
MADNDERCLARRKLGFEPFDRGQIKVVRRLVKQQDIGRRREYAGKRGAACLTAGQHRRVPVAAEAELFQEIVRGVAVVGRAEARLDIIDDTVKACEIGFLRGAYSDTAPFRERLAMLGWVEGGNLRMDYRFADGDPDRLAAYAEELVNLRPDLIFTFNGPAARAVQQRTAVIPIVFVGAGDPAATGMVGNLARPGGNMTGFAGSFGSLGGKWLELFKEAVPGLTRVAHVVSPISDFADPRSGIPTSMDTAAAQLGVTIVRIRFHDTAEIEAAISAFAAAPHGGLLATGAIARAHFDAIQRLALRYRLPLMNGGAAIVGESILMSHGPDLVNGSTLPIGPPSAAAASSS